MSRLPIRVKLTVAFGSAMLLMLAGAALFVSLRLRADLDDRIDASLASRLAAVLESAPGSTSTLERVALEDPEETFVQLLAPSGDVLASVGTVRGAALSPAETKRATKGTVRVERMLPAVDGRARLLAGATRGNGATATVVVVGQSLVDRDDALSSVLSSFLVGGVVAIGLASGIGYVLAAAGLAPVEAMRRRASEVSLRPSEDGLPLPAPHDEIRRLGETLNEMLARLRSAFEREGQFVADASHELRTPIAIIKTELEGALQVAHPASSVHTSLLVATEECDRLAQLAEDLLVIARAAGGQLPLRPELTWMAELLLGVRDRFTDRAARRCREIRVEVPPGLAVRADPDRLRQALGNLVENALRHGEGQIILAARWVVAGIEIDVVDHGSGIPAEFAAQAFERFTRADRARSGQGVGLGLAIVQSIAQAHGGNAVIVPGESTTLRIWLPDQRA